MNSPFPGWARPNAEASPDSLIVQAAAALAAIHAPAVAEQKWRAAWLDRLALRAAAGTLRALDRPESEVALRDALMFLPPGADPGPAGNIYAMWRRFARRSPIDHEEDFAEEVERCGVPWDKDLADLWRYRADIPAAEAPIVAAVMVSTAPIPLRREALPAAFLMADATLALRSRWPYGVPLLATAPGRLGMGSAEATDRYMAYAKAAAAAHSLYTQLSDRAAALLSVEGLRAKGANALIGAILTSDALRAGGPDAIFHGVVVTQRARRRFLEKLATDGLITELTGRSSSRLYGM